MRKLFRMIFMYFEEKKNWKNKMDCPGDPVPMTKEEYAALRKQGKL